MSITSDIRAKADSALEQGRTQLTHAQSQLAGVIDQAQTQLTDVADDVTGRVNGLATKASETVGDLRTQAEKAINLDAIKNAVEPYLTQAKEYRNAVTDRASSLVGTVTGDKRVAKVIDSAEAAAGVVVETVTERVVKPVQHLTGRGTSTTSTGSTGSTATTRKRTATKSPAKAAKAASTRPAPKPATKTTARKAPAKKATSASAAKA